MTDRFVDLEERVERLEAALRELDGRLSTFVSESRPDREDVPVFEPARAAGDLSGVLALLGRSCLVFGGAFLIRAATEAGAVSRAAGAVAGLLYAGIWLFFSDRDGRRGRNSSAAFYGVTAAGIAFPLLWELSTRFGILSSGAAAGAVAAAAILLLVLSLRQKTAALAWAATLGSVSTLFALVVSARAIGPAAGAAIFLAAATIALAKRRGWLGPLWVAAIGADLAVLAAASSVGRNLTPGLAAGLALALPVCCVPTLILPVIRRRRAVTPFEAVQAAASLLLGFGAAAVSARAAGGAGVAILGLSALGAGLCAYTLAFASGPSSGSATNARYFASVAGLMMIAGGATWLSPSALAGLWSALAAAAALVSLSGGRSLSALLRWHAVAFIGAAAVASRFAGVVGRAFWGDPGGGGLRPSAAVLAVLVSSIAVFSILAAVRRSGSRPSLVLPALLAAAVALAGASAMLVLVVVPAPRMDAGSLAAARTGALAVASIAAALLGRFGRVPEAGWLVYPLLGLGGIKLLLEDVPRGRPLTLFVGFAFFGAALLAAPRIARSGRKAAAIAG